MTVGLSAAQLGLSFAAGSLTTLSPCVFPMLPLVVGGAVQANTLAPVAMGVGMAASFATIGIVVGALGPALGIDGDFVRTAGGVLLIAMAVVMLVPSLSARLARAMLPIANAANGASARLAPGSLLGALSLGAILGLVWSPCSGPLLGSALALVATEGGAARGAILLGVFGFGAAIPLVAVAYLSRQGIARARGWIMARIEGVWRAFAVLLAATGVAILTGADKRLEAWILRWLPESWINLTVAI